MKNKKNIFKILLLVVMLFFAFNLAACGDELPTDEPVTEEVTQPTDSETEYLYTLEDLEAIPFNDKTVTFNDKTHRITIASTDIPEGVKVTYSGNNQKQPGTYTIVATIKYKDLVVKKEATLIIEALPSVLSSDMESATFLLYEDTIRFTYLLNNEKQTVEIHYFDGDKEVSLGDVHHPGTYTAKLYARASYGYADSNVVEIPFTVLQSEYGVTFTSKEVTWDGTEKSIEVEGTLSDGYTVTYEGNTGTEAGDYFAVAKIKDSEGSVVDELRAVLSIENPENAEFAAYLDQFIVDYCEGDQYMVNLFFANPEAFGFEAHYDVFWYTYEANAFDDFAEGVAAYQEALDELYTYKDYRKSDDQEVAYRKVESLLKEEIEYYSDPKAMYRKLLYIDSFGGYVSSFLSYVEDYPFRNKTHVQDILDYLEACVEAFPSYLIFVEEKTNAGYPYSDYTLREMRSYLKEILDNGEEYYLADVLDDRIDELEFLTSEEKETFKSQIRSDIQTKFMPAVETLYEGLEPYLGKLAAEDEGYWAAYGEEGKADYLAELQGLLGLTDFDIDAYITKVANENSRTGAATMDALMKIYNKHGSTYQKVIDNTVVLDATPEEMMEYLREFAKTIVPELKSTPKIVIKEMDQATAKVSNAVAFYRKSTVDATAVEYVTLNPLKLGDGNDLLSTLSHEGYPGHLYAYVFSKEANLPVVSTIMTSTAHAEGWATYVESQLYLYAAKQSVDENFQMVMDYLYQNSLSGFILETRIDVGVHYEGWTIEDIASYLDAMGYSSDSAGDIYRTVIEMPSQYAAYGYGKIVFHELHNNARRTLGDAYSEVEFNEMLLSKGWTDLGELYNTYKEYMLRKCHEVGVNFVD